MVTGRLENIGGSANPNRDLWRSLTLRRFFRLDGFRSVRPSGEKVSSFFGRMRRLFIHNI